MRKLLYTLLVVAVLSSIVLPFHVGQFGAGVASASGLNPVDLSDFTVGGVNETYITDHTPYRTLATAMPLGADAYRYKDYGAGYFSGNFTHYIDYRLEAYSASGWASPWMLANSVNNAYRTTVVTKYVSASADDIGVFYDGATWTAQGTNTDNFRIGYWNTTTVQKFGGGFRFLAVNIPAGAVITSATIMFTSYSALADTTVKAYITGELSGTPSTFSTMANYASRRGTVVGGANNNNRTALQVDWANIPAWSLDEAGADTTTPNFAAVVQEVVNTVGAITDLVVWVDDHDGRSDVVNNHQRQGHTYDAHADTTAPKLVITYYTSTENFIAVRTSGATLAAIEFYNGTTYTSNTYTMTKGDIVYLKIDRAGTAFNCYVYKEPSRTTLLATISLTLQSAVAYQYLYVMNSYASGSTNPVTCWSGNLYMDETPPSMLDELLSNFIIYPDAQDGFESVADGADIDTSTGMTWVTTGTVVGESEITPPEGSISAKFLQVGDGASSIAEYTYPGTQDDEFMLCGWVYITSIAANSSAQLFGMWDLGATKLIQAAVVDVSGTKYWRIWKYNAGYTYSSQTTCTVNTGTWYQVLLFQGYVQLASLWVRAASADTWTEVEAVEGIDTTWDTVRMGRSTGSPAATYYIDAIQYQKGYTQTQNIARGGSGDGTILMTTNNSVSNIGRYFSTAAPTANPSSWTYRGNITGLYGFIVWDSAHSCWWSFELRGTQSVDAYMEVYEIDPVDWSHTLRGTYDPVAAPPDGVSDDNLTYITPSRIIESGELLCTMHLWAPALTASDCYFIKFNTSDYTWSAAVLMCDETDLANYMPVEAYLWRRLSDNALLCINRFHDIITGESYCASNIYQKYQVSTTNGTTWGDISNPGGDTGLHINKYGGNLNAFYFGGYLWYQGYDSRVCGVTTVADYQSFVGRADAEDGALITQRNWGWGPLTAIWDKGFCFPAGNGDIDAKDGQSGNPMLDVTFRLGIGWFRQVTSGGIPDISNTPSSWNAGVVQPSSTVWAKTSTTTPPSFPLADGNCTGNVTNNSSFSVNILFSMGNMIGGTQWTIGANPGSNIFRMRLYISGAGNNTVYTALSETPQTLISSLGAGLSKSYEFAIDTPTNNPFPDGVQKSGNITLAGEAS